MDLEEDAAWLDYRRRFSGVYDDANYGGGLQAVAMRAGHRLLERDFGPQDTFARVLEIGAGTGEHLPFVRHRYDEYVLSDADPETLRVAQRKLAGTGNGALVYQEQTGEKLDVPDAHCERVIASHVLEHIYRPHLALKEWARVIVDGGWLSILLPTDPGIAWRLGRHLGPRKKALTQGIAYDYVMAREHVNSCTNLVALIRHYFPDRREAWWPTGLASTDLNLFYCAQVRVKRGIDVG